jgi:hypothetical protein
MLAEGKDMNFYQINREERHFGFLFLSALISHPEFRKEIFAVLNSCASTHLDDQTFDIYAEVAIFRDHWNSLGDHNQYTPDLHAKRLSMLQGILGAMEMPLSLVDEEDLFWTGAIGKSKLWYPGKWPEAKIGDVETRKGIDGKRLWRCRWLCNAKPDVMIHSGNTVLFIEVKVESGMGASDHGYNQEQTQNDIIVAGARVIEWMSNATVRRLNLTHHDDPTGITWDQVIEIYRKTRNRADTGADMIERHLEYLPKRNRAWDGVGRK